MRFRLLALMVAASGVALAAAPALAWRAGPYMVFFPFGGDSIDDRARAILDNLAYELAAAPEAHIVVQGHADRAGPDAVNLALSCRRALRAQAYLLTRGVAAERMVVRAYGEDEPLVETEDGGREPQNRRVEFRFGTAAEIGEANAEGHRCR